MLGTSCDSFCESVKKYFETMIRESVIVSPGRFIYTLKKRAAAFSLTLSNDPRDSNSHFVQSENQLSHNEIYGLNEIIAASLDEEKTSYIKRSFLSSLAHCEFLVFSNLQRLSGKINNECELRYVLGDPIMTLL